MSHANWLSPLVTPARLMKKASMIADKINKSRTKFDFIAVSGVSGLVMGGVVSALTDIPLVIVRKQKGDHSVHLIEYPDNLKRAHYCIVDDLIDSGKTMTRIVKEIEREIHLYSAKNKRIYPKLCRIYLYRYCSKDILPVESLTGIFNDVPVTSVWEKQDDEEDYN